MLWIEVRETLNVGPFTTAQQNFLEYHRDMVLLKAARYTASGTDHTTGFKPNVKRSSHPAVL